MTSALDTKPIFTDYVRYGTLTVMAGHPAAIHKFGLGHNHSVIIATLTSKSRCRGYETGEPQIGENPLNQVRV